MKVDASIVQIITAIFAMIGTIVSPVLVLWIKGRLEAGQAHNLAKIGEVGAKVDVYHKEVDGIKTELVAAVKGKGEAEGNLQGRLEQTQENKEK